MTATPAQIRTNHERAQKLAAKWSKIPNVRVTAQCDGDRPAVLVLERKTMGGVDRDKWKVTATYKTHTNQLMGVPVNWNNDGSSSLSGTMAQGLYDREQYMHRRREALVRLEREALQMREALAHNESTAARIREELSQP